MKKVAIVTGSARGIGREIARTLLAADYRVVLLDINSLQLEETARLFANKDALALMCDVGNEESVIKTIAVIMEQYGRVDLVVNNAATMQNKAIHHLSYEEWHRAMDTNLGSVFLFAKYLGEELKKNRGVMINIASTRAHMSEPDTESYSASKGGMIALTHALAASFAPDVRINAISPGWIDSRDEGEQNAKPLSPADHEQHLSGRVGKSADIASLVLWLADDKNDFVTGQEFVIDGGMTKKMIYR